MCVSSALVQQIINIILYRAILWLCSWRDGQEVFATLVCWSEGGFEGSMYDPASWTTNTKRGDFFPYADCDHCYWSGYFSSRQGLKKMERVGSSCQSTGVNTIICEYSGTSLLHVTATNIVKEEELTGIFIWV